MLRVHVLRGNMLVYERFQMKITWHIYDLRIAAHSYGEA